MEADRWYTALDQKKCIDSKGKNNVRSKLGWGRHGGKKWADSPTKGVGSTCVSFRKLASAAGSDQVKAHTRGRQLHS